MDKYFELQYWLTIIGMIVTCLFIIGGVIWFLATEIIDFYRRKSKKWTFNYIHNRWEKKDKDE